MAPHELGEIVAGPQLLAVLLTCGLLGVLSVQVYLYYLAFPNDRVYMKSLVYGIYFLEVVQSVLMVEMGFRNFVTGFGDVEVFAKVQTMWLGIPIFTAAVTFLVQAFYAYRIRISAQSTIVAGVIIALSFVQLGAGIATGVYAKQGKYYSSLITPRNLVIHGIWNVGSTLCDIIIAVCMSYYLSRYDPTIKQTKIFLKKIIRLTIETGSLTAIIGIVCFSLAFMSSTPNSYYQVPMFIIGQVYANSMLVLINSRTILGSEETPQTILSVLKFGTIPANDKYSVTETQNGDVGVDTEERVKFRA